MRFFRFSRWMIFLMLGSLASVVGAIEVTRTLAVRLIDPGAEVTGAWWTIPAVLVTVLAFMAVVGAIGYGLLTMMGRSGTDRLSNTPARQK